MTKLGDTKFSVDMAKFVRKTKMRADLVVRKIMYDMDAAVVARTPRDTGRLVGNWQLTQDVLPTSILDVGGEPGSASGRRVEQTVIQEHAAKIREFEAGHIHYIVNNLPYAPVVEYGLYPAGSSTGKTVGGYSAQAPSGMVRVTVLEYRQYLEKIIQDIDNERTGGVV